MKIKKKIIFEVRSHTATRGGLALCHYGFVYWGKYKAMRKGEIDYREAGVDAKTELVIDGYQGSANSFATVAFKSAQRRPVRLAHHLHAPVQVIRGLRLGVPAVITVREPRDAALSLIRRWPSISAAQALRWYLRYYRALLPYSEDLIISPFEMTTRRLDLIFGAVNDRFGTDFDLFIHTHEAVASVRGLRSEAAEARAAAVRSRKAREFETSLARGLLADAESVYHRFILTGVTGA